MILHRYSKNDGSYVWTRGKTDALAAARKHAKITSNEQTLTVEAVTFRELTTKTLILALLNGEEVIAEDEQGDEVVEVIAEIKGRAKKPKAPPKPKAVKVETEEGRPRRASPYPEEEDKEDQRYVNVYTKHGCRLMKLEALRPGMKIQTADSNGTPAAW